MNRHDTSIILRSDLSWYPSDLFPIIILITKHFATNYPDITGIANEPKHLCRLLHPIWNIFFVVEDEFLTATVR